MQKCLIRIAHSPDTDDIFMFYALKTGKIIPPDFEFEIVGDDIEALNRMASDEVYDITAISMHAYAHLSSKYALLSSGASMAEQGYGPVVVAKDGALGDFNGKVIGVPGELTTAFLLLKMAMPEFNYIVLKPVAILEALLRGEIDAGLIIHEGQIQYSALGLKIVHRVMDTWRELAGELPLPLGGSAVKKSLGETLMRELSDLQKSSIEYGLAHREDAIAYCHKVNPVLSRTDMDRYLNWYVNRRTLDIGAEGTPYSLILVAGKPPVVMNGAYPYIAVKQLIDEALQDAQKR
jgi:1,4-dihydroxy-6-naphthoate synthase